MFQLYDFSQSLAAQGIISDEYLDGGETFTDIKGPRKEIEVSQSTTNDIFLIYCTLNEKLAALWNLYKHEKEKKLTAVSFDEWDPFTRKLTLDERELVKPVSNNVIICDKKCVKNEKTGRTTLFSTVRVATERSDSSLVRFKADEDNLYKFGRITKIFQHRHWEKITTFCNIEVLEDAHFDSSLSLWRCPGLRGSSKTLVALDYIEHPVAYAVDTEGIFILN